MLGAFVWEHINSVTSLLPKNWLSLPLFIAMTLTQYRMVFTLRKKVFWLKLFLFWDILIWDNLIDSEGYSW